MAVHIEIDELADAAAGGLDDGRTQVVVQHVERCASCRSTWSSIAEVSRQLSAEPRPPMPPEVARRLNGVVAAESRGRSSTRDESSGPSESWHKPALGTFEPDLPRRNRRRTVASVVGACTAAAAVGFAGFMTSVTAGLGEPSPHAPAAISGSHLAAQAQALKQATDVSPHRFSKAWRCAREVTPGRIRGLTSVTVDGQPALLVYSTTNESGRDGVSLVTVVTGCANGEPTAGESTTVPR
ncbi:MAG TPA: hypothetical protein VEQ66_02310 [Propionibacteriaceae bacterium]|nr:hypothetical protein [Propionibacteriaceae bacterium]